MSINTYTKYLKAVALTMAAALYIPLVSDWCAPGLGLHEAVKALGGAPGAVYPPLWAALVRYIGRDIVGLGTLSMLEALLCVAVLMVLAEDLVAYAIRLAQKRLTRSDASFAGVKSAAIVLTAAAFVLTPGFLRAATRIGPLMELILLPLAALTLVIQVVTTVADDERTIDRLIRGKYTLLVAVGLFCFALWEAIHARRLLFSEWPSFGLFFLFGLFPLLAFCDLTRRWKLLKRRYRRWYFGGWTFFVTVIGMVALLSLGHGHVVSRMAARLVRQTSAYRAIVTDGALDDVVFFLLPDGKRTVSVARDFDPAYGRELSDWLQSFGTPADSDLVFAAELGPRALLDEWAKTDPEGLRATLLTHETYFPTVEAWREALDELKDLSWREPLGGYLRRLLGACGNHLACAFLEKGDRDAAWQIFWEALNRADTRNYTILINMSGMVERGYVCSKKDQDRLKFLRDAVERDLQSPKRRRLAALAGGRLYVDPKVREQREAERKKALENDELTPQARAFIATVSAAPKDAKSAQLAREAIRKGIDQGLVRVDRIGDQLLVLDRILADWESAERDSISVLRLERRHAMANSMMGMLAGSRGDYPRAERYLRRAMASIVWTGDSSTLNDLAFTLIQLGRASEAEPLARQAVAKSPEDWNFHETLALSLIRGGNPDEGERELEQAMALAEKVGQRVGTVTRFALDRAWLYKVRGNKARLQQATCLISERLDPTEPQKAEVEELRK